MPKSPGIGASQRFSADVPVLLVEHDIDRVFRHIPTDLAEIAKVRAEMSVRRSALERELLKGVRDLETLKAEALTKRQAAAQYQAAYVALKQAEVDWKFLG